MVRITEELVRKRAEHNEGEISSLEELSLHQQDIEKIEHLDKWCKDLRILYLQSNLIDRIENISRLKKLEYINLALNNIQIIENLEGCESLKKLDLTVNFVADVFGVDSLCALMHFEELYLTGNPCTDFEGYRAYVVATLPHLKWLDGVEIEKSQRLRAEQDLPEVRLHLKEQLGNYVAKKEQEAQAKLQRSQHGSTGFDGRWYTDVNGSSASDENTENSENFWNEPTEYTPESRKKVHEHLKAAKNKESKEDKEAEKKAPRRMFNEHGRALNVNEAKVEFKLENDEQKDVIVLDISAFKHMDTSLMDVDVQPSYVRVTLKGKVFQLCLDEEVKPSTSKAERSLTTGHLVITMPKENPAVRHPPASLDSSKDGGTKNAKASGVYPATESATRARLEVDPLASHGPDFANIVNSKAAVSLSMRENSTRIKQNVKPRDVSSDFVDDPTVPPLL